MKSPAFSFGFRHALLLIGALTGLMFGTVACADPEGTTPECTQDVGNGTHEVKDDGCNPFAVCLGSDGKKVPAAQCCKGLTNEYEKQVCLYGYGGADFPKSTP